MAFLIIYFLQKYSNRLKFIKNDFYFKDFLYFGKSIFDSYFGMLSKWVLNWYKTQFINSTKDL